MFKMKSIEFNIPFSHQQINAIFFCRFFFFFCCISGAYLFVLFPFFAQIETKCLEILVTHTHTHTHTHISTCSLVQANKWLA